MTAEIAILNKSAVALATDSAVTISVGDSHEKIFDSADKLFELSDLNSIGIMIYNTMDFMGTPLAVVVKQFRSTSESFSTVKEAGKAFLDYLQEDGEKAPAVIKNNLLYSTLQPYFKKFQTEVNDAILKRLQNSDLPEDIPAFASEILKNSVQSRIDVLKKMQGASFVGTTSSKIRLDKSSKDLVGQLVDSYFDSANEENSELLENFATLFVRKNVFSQSKSGIIISGFGSSEKFPSLVWYETDGIMCGHLKFREAAYIDVDRSGCKAAVMPFAQKDMIERFLYGLDENIERNIKSYCKTAVPEISKSLIEKVESVDEVEKTHLQDQAHVAESEFLNQLDEGVFEKVRESSRKEIEDMVEFMPKPEMAKMAEALIDLTSIKRRVTRGMETVGGPVDVAVISRSEGFVWVKRKHYFSAEFNGRYKERMSSEVKNRKDRIGDDNG